jgi:hypothetical protein
MRGKTLVRATAIALLVALPALFALKFIGVPIAFISVEDKAVAYALVAVWNLSFGYSILRII